MRQGRPLLWVAFVTVPVLLAGCGTQPPYSPGAPPAPAQTDNVEPTPGPKGNATPETPHPRATATTSARPPRALSAGSHGSWVRHMQEELIEASYDPGPIDGRFGAMTLHAVIAYQKVNGLPRDGVVTRTLFDQISKAVPPTAEPLGLPVYIDVDLDRQVLFEVRDGVVTSTLPISTGSGRPYTSTSGPVVAQTPKGLFEIIRKIPGWHVSYLGGMYYPSYFHGGWAIHGSESVPTYPASHGCVRIPMHSAIGFYGRNPLGTAVYVHD